MCGFGFLSLMLIFMFGFYVVLIFRIVKIDNRFKLVVIFILIWLICVGGIKFDGWIDIFEVKVI